MKIVGNILGSMKKSIGKSMTFSIWKGIQCARQYAVPSNPRTPAQVEQRNLFKSVQFIVLLFSLAQINVWWRKYAVKQSAYNAIMQSNLNANEYPINPANLIFAKGGLTPTPLTAAVYNTVDGKVNATFDTEATGNQLSTDNMVLVVYNTEVPVIVTSSAPVTRADGTISVILPAGLDFGHTFAYLFAYRNLGASNEAISNNSYLACTEP